MNVVSKAAVATFILLTVACARSEDKFRPPFIWSKCAARTISNEYLVKLKERSLERHYLSMRELRVLLRDPKIEWVEPNYRIVYQEVEGTPVVDEVSLITNSARVHAEYAWERGFFGRGIKVAVVDSGIDSRQGWLQSALQDPAGEWGTSPQPNGIDDDHNGHIDDIYGWNFVEDSARVLDESGHGTHIAGIIAAAHSSGSWLRGIAPEVKLISADFMNLGNGDEFHALKAIEYSLGRGAKIINNSWSSLCSYSLRQSFIGWQGLNVIFVNAAGNEGVNIDSVDIFPSNLRLVNSITVGSVGANYRRSKFSNYGRNVIIYAPGEDIYGIAANDSSGLTSTFRSGTSMAAPFVTGGLALAWSAHPKLSAAEMVRVIHSMSKHSGKPWPLFSVPDLLKELERAEITSMVSP